MTRFAIGLLVLLLSPSARAAALDDDARVHFSAGVKAYDAKDFDGALREFRAADAAKPSPATKRNVGLALRALGREVEAIEALEAMLAMPGVADDVRARALRAIEEMRPHVGIVRVRVVVRGSPVTSWRLRVDDAELPAERPARLILAPGAHAIAAHVDGVGDGARAVSIAAGDDREVTIDLAPAIADATPAALVPIVAIEAPLPPPPPPYSVGPASADEASALPPPAPTFRPRWYVRGGLSLAGESRTLDQGFDLSRQAKDLGGPSLVARFGHEMGTWWSVELLAELGVMTPPTFVSPNALGRDADVRMVRESLVPMLRVHTLGRWRFAAAMGVGATFEQVRAVLGEKDGTATRTGQGAGVAWITDVGAEVDLGKALLELGVFAEVHGLGSPADDRGQPFFGDTVATRGGLRLLVGWRL